MDFEPEYSYKEHGHLAISREGLDRSEGSEFKELMSLEVYA